MKISLVIPTYNEKENIKELLNELKKVLKPYSHEIIIVDDNSHDGTWRVVKKISEKDKNVKLVRRVGERGLSSAVLRGFEKARGDVLGVMDADLSHDPKILPRMIKEIKEHDLVVGSRKVKGGGVENGSLKRKLISSVASLMARIILNVKVKDPMSGYFLIKKSVYARCKDELNPVGYKILLELLVKGRPRKIKEIPFIFRDRKRGKSKLNHKVIKDYLKHLLRLRFA